MFSKDVAKLISHTRVGIASLQLSAVEGVRDLILLFTIYIVHNFFQVLLRCDSLMREKLSRDVEMVVALLHAVDLCRLSDGYHSEVVTCLSLLAYHDVLRISEDSTSQLSLPATVNKRYHVRVNICTANYFDVMTWCFIKHFAMHILLVKNVSAL